MLKYIKPEVGLPVFTCPYCAITSQQEWGHIQFCSEYIEDRVQVTGEHYDAGEKWDGIYTSWCINCEKATLWESRKIVYPSTGIFPSPHEDLPQEIKEIYNEACSIANNSPRSACALFRLAIEMLLNHIGKEGTINNNIKKLVEEGLNPKVQKILDILRVTGNNAVHPGVIEFNDETPIIAFSDWINMVTDILITQPAKIERVYNNLPEKDKNAIGKRDN